MKNEIEYYLGYLRNPKETLENGFQNINEIEVILYKDKNEYREIATKESMYLMNQNEVFDGHKVFKSYAGFVGRLGRKLETREALKLMTEIRGKGLNSYINNLLTIIQDTLEETLKGEQEYQDERRKFASEFSVDALNVPDKATYKKL